ncbi:hypothetical protein [Streptomyces sp. NPDC003077]|uniref:hypothetical protein n=1 Tax=Streptomyces sp. NPDC003077 TaxID=3154443 RepID=UPI0033BEEB30
MDIMRRVKPDSATADHDALDGDVPDLDDNFDDTLDVFDTYEIFRVICPDCARPIAMLADEDTLPEHALCASPWNPFGLTVCQGSGRPVSDAAPADDEGAAQDHDAATLLTLPEGFDWRRQPFSHIGGPGTRPVRVPAHRLSS